MNRIIPGVSSTALALFSILSCSGSDKATGPTLDDSTADAYRYVATVSVKLANDTLASGSKTQATASLFDRWNRPMYRRVSWSSSDPAVATVSDSGVVSAVAAGTTNIIAAAGTRSGSATLVVINGGSVDSSPPAPAPVASVSVSPASATLQPGATVQLSAVMRDASGNVLSGRVVSWSSANTGIASVNSTSGLVTAVDIGTVLVTATSEGKTATSTINVQAPPPPPPPPPSGSSNEPTGMTVLRERSFSSLQDPDWDTDNSLSIVQDATAPKSPSSVIRVTYRTGFAGGAAPGHTGTAHASHRVMYISYWGKLSTNFWGHLTSVNKQLYEWANGSNVFYFEAAGVGSGPLSPEIVLQGTPTDGVYGPNLVPSAHFTRGQWYHVEIVLNGNSAGTRDGSVDWWLDGVHVGSKTNLQFTSSATAWGIFEFTPVWGGVTDNVPATMTLDWDHVYLSGKN